MLALFNSTTDTVPPKKRILDTTQDFYTAGFVPGANVYFSYDQPEGIIHHDDLHSYISATCFK
jgi:tether containing UBX domain for GLUT4